MYNHPMQRESSGEKYASFVKGKGHFYVNRGQLVKKDCLKNFIIHQPTNGSWLLIFEFLFI